MPTHRFPSPPGHSHAPDDQPAHPVDSNRPPQDEPEPPYDEPEPPYDEPEPPARSTEQSPPVPGWSGRGGRPSPAYRAVIFDFFGTLTCGSPRGQQHRVVAALLGCAVEALFEVLDRSFYLRATGALGDATDTMRWICEQAGARPSTADLRAAVEARVEAVRADTRLRPEAVTVLRAVRRRGARTALISDCTHELPALWPQLPVAPLLDARVFSVQVGRCKPDPAIYLTACQRLGVAPGDCLYVGDGGSQELTGAARAGMTPVRLAAADLDGHLVFNPDRGWSGLALTSLAEVPGLLDVPRSRAGSTPAGSVPVPGGAGCGV
ncbi:HAD-IA family hydrolase [Plantactinospora veratri]|uniref:HAD-IA family hydrolase n=1 Tax=Plantactinospora veratri TaxID=1436122 RepID=A0ABU7SN59_9ACTN